VWESHAELYAGIRKCTHALQDLVKRTSLLGKRSRDAVSDADAAKARLKLLNERVCST
jgi:hypothetical protein